MMTCTYDPSIGEAGTEEPLGVAVQPWKTTHKVKELRETPMLTFDLYAHTHAHAYTYVKTKAKASRIGRGL